MQVTLKEFYTKYVMQGDLFANPAINVLILVLLGFLTLWIFNIVVNHMEKRLKKDSFLKSNKIFLLLLNLLLVPEWSVLQSALPQRILFQI